MRTMKDKTMQSIYKFISIFIFLMLVLGQQSQVMAEDAPATSSPDEASTGEQQQATLYPIPDYSGDLASRPALTGDWAGARTNLAEKGFQFKFDATQYYQGVTSGGFPDNGEWEDNGVSNYRVLLDSGKAGFWPGGFIEAHGQSYWGNTVNGNVGAVSPVNFQPSLKAAAPNGTYLSHLALTQFVSERLAFVIGKVNTAAGDTNDYAHGEGDTQFMNGAFNLNPTTYLSSPYSVLGVGFAYLFGDDKENVFGMLVYDGDGQVNTSGFDTAFHGRTTVGANVRFRTDFLGMKGHQYFGAIYGFGKYSAQGSSPITDLPDTLPGVEPKQVNDTWTLFYNFDQQLVSDPNNPKRDIGIFSRVGFADTRSSVIKSFYSIGLGGNGLFPSRVQDDFGIGYYYMGFTSERVQLILPEDYEQGLEVFYNLTVTPALKLTADLQVIDGAINGADTAWVAGIRGRIEF